MGSLERTWQTATFEELYGVKLIASTPNARVFRARMKDESGVDLDVAVRKPKMSSEEALQRFFDEVELRAKLTHQNISQLLAADTEAPGYMTVSPWQAGGCLFDVIHGQSVRFGFQRILELGLQFARGLEYLHDRNIVHRDLKSANLLVNGAWKDLSIGDLDLAADVDQLKKRSEENNGRALGRGPSNGRLKHMVGTLVYMAPEVLSNAPHNFAADVYAFGITLNEIAAAAVPYVDRQLPVPELHTVLETRFNEVTLRRAIVKDGMRPSLAKNCPHEFTSLIERCWSADPAQRPSMSEVVSMLEAIADKGSVYVSSFEGAAGIDNAVKETAADVTLLSEIRDTEVTKPSWSGAIDRSYLPDDVSPGLSSTPGVRGADRMEDREIIEMNVAGLPDLHVVGVYDGHGGENCAQFVKDHLVRSLARSWESEVSDPESSITHAYEDLDAAFLGSTPETEQSGCTALTAMFAGRDLFVANVGDCRAVLCRNGEAVPVSFDQTAAVPAEAERVEARGGQVAYHEDIKQWRVNGEIAVTRSIGDRRLKPALTSTPVVTKFRLQDADEFIIMATDGLWDVISSEEAVHMVKTTVKVADMAAKRLALKALIERESQDNITVIVVHLKQANGFSELKQ